MPDLNVLNQDFREFIELLHLYDVKYLITGGYAVAIYSHPRYTGDINFWIEPSLENGQKLASVFDEFGLSSFNIKAEDFTKSSQVIQVGYPPFRIDILTSIDGVEFSEAYPSRSQIEIDGIQLSFISLEDLKKIKELPAEI